MGSGGGPKCVEWPSMLKTPWTLKRSEICSHLVWWFRLRWAKLSLFLEFLNETWHDWSVAIAAGNVFVVFEI